MRELNPPLRLILCGLAAALGIFVYCYGLDSQHIPKNGDESVYVNIARLTGQSGHWLPLLSQSEAMRNTKPPMLFWQGIASTMHGASWSLWNLRYPSVIYTLLTAALVFLLARKFSRDDSKGLIAALAYLAFFSTYRYGRPYLTNAPETFWLFLAYFLLLYWREAALRSRWLPLLLGVIVGIGLLYKSFALLLPVGVAVAWWYLQRRDYRLGVFLRNDAWKLVAMAAIALGLFSLWFLLDPRPQTVWQDFVVRENAGKFDHAGDSYVSKFLWGGSSVWTMLLGGAVNAGLLALPVAALMAAAPYKRRALSDDERLLWIWLLATIIVFSLPSQRSARYLLTAMPALAVLCGLGWDRLSRGWFIATLALAAAAIAFIGYESLLLQRASDPALFPATFWLLLLATIGFCVAASCWPALTRPAVPVAGLLLFFVMAAFLKPFDGQRGNFSPEAQAFVAGREVWVPSDFSTSEEAYRFILPSATIRTYQEPPIRGPDELARDYRLFTVRVPLSAAPCDGCRVLSERLDLRGRLSSENIHDILHGRVFESVFLKEWLIESSAAVPSGGEAPQSPRI
ncbi:MAG: phospholipid carrier-dependent glycosyltransferase [Steroidobacteraceae bacterium]|jgi:4-amino-4-deoxy-L-arabinose transferase-like glycosyltransferase